MSGWSGPAIVACSCHIVVAEQSILEGQQVLRAVVQDINERFHINQPSSGGGPRAAATTCCVGQRLRTPPGTSRTSAPTR
jgi:hypothetical protein